MLSLNTAYDAQMKLRDHLKKLRKSQKLSVDKLTVKSGVPNATIRKFESTGNISFRQFLMLFEALHNIDDIVKLCETSESEPSSIDEVLSRNVKL
ncbi:transcriptional regulator [Vibrio sp. SCSIO 43137]|uniref:transcriptional regulator n=1 Tax=Vibrio sp. SCSIO 43137 TaxID=3021011 RepID=UPI002308274A|nr:transcriptional regulator [Vibrio sp. SCSIO 43137]WCE32188.1 transcriptional regulator [Vibrio sp. SCSIO 43137]